MILINTPFEEGGIYCNGLYITGSDENACDAVTPQLKDFSFEKFAISATFKVNSIEEAGGNPVFVGGDSYRWLTVWLDSDSLIGFGTNYEHHYHSNTWHTVTAMYNSATRQAACYLDGVLVDSYTTELEHGNERVVGITHGGMAETFHGYLKNLKIYSVAPDYLEQDSLALVALYTHTDGTNWTDNSNWLAGPVDTWYGITVESGRVTKIELGENNLYGFIPEEIGDLTQLEKLALWSNQLMGPIPAEIGDLTHIGGIHLSNNQLEGEIPAEIGNLSQLYHFSAGSNYLSGPIPGEIGQCTELTQLFLSNNLLSESLPEELGNCRNLIECFLQNNQLSGPVPESLGNLTRVRYLRLNQNQLTGTIPDTLSHCTSLVSLLLSDNQLIGNIPAGFGYLPGLTGLYVSNNQLSGVVPADLANLMNLEKFTCNNNRFTDFPDLSALPELVQLHIYNNQFTFEDIEPNLGVADYWYAPQDSVGIAQTLETWLGADLTLSVSVGGSQNLYQWARDGVNLDGADTPEYTMNPVVSADTGRYVCEITSSLANELTLYSRPIQVVVADAMPALVNDSLALVDFYHNMDGDNWTDNTGWLSGPLSEWTGVILYEDRVTGINLRSNGLSGTLPASFADLSALTSLDLAYNTIQGELPPEIFKLSRLAHLSLTGNGISGSIPAAVAQLTVLERLYLANNALTGPVPPEIGQCTLLYTLHLYNNQLEGPLPDAVYDLTRLQTLHLSGNRLEGAISDEMLNMTALEELLIAFNRFTDLPDLSSHPALTRAEVMENRLTFEDIVPNMNLDSFTYAPQDSVGEAKDTTVTEGASLSLPVEVGGQANVYQWVKDGTDIPEATDSIFILNGVAFSDAGQYHCVITNPTVPELILCSRPVTVQIEPASAADKETIVPVAFALDQNFPNPFNPVTTIHFDVKEPCRVALKVYNLMGEAVRTPASGFYAPGRYQIPFSSEGLDSGLYFYHIRMGNFQAVKKMVVME